MIKNGQCQAKWRKPKRPFTVGIVRIYRAGGIEKLVNITERLLKMTKTGISLLFTRRRDKCVLFLISRKQEVFSRG
jgi:hypothetical protein